MIALISPKIGQKKRKISHVDLTTPEWTNEDLKLDHGNEPSHQEWAIILIKGCTKSKSSRRRRLSKKKNVGKKASRHSLRCIARRLFPFFTYSPPRPLMTVIPFAFLQPVPAFFHSLPFSEPVAFSPLTLPFSCPLIIALWVLRSSPIRRRRRVLMQAVRFRSYKAVRSL